MEHGYILVEFSRNAKSDPQLVTSHIILSVLSHK